MTQAVTRTAKLSRKSHVRLEILFSQLLWLYNEVLRERKASCKAAELSVSRFDQFKSLTLRRQADPGW